MGQKFYANPNTRRSEPNGAISYGPGGPFDCVGPFAKIQNCPIAGTALRLTCYATGYSDSYFSVPACTRYRGRYIKGYFTSDENGPEFRPLDGSLPALGLARVHCIGAKSRLVVKTADYMGVTDDAALRALCGEYYIRVQFENMSRADVAAYAGLESVPGPEWLGYPVYLQILREACETMRAAQGVQS